MKILLLGPQGSGKGTIGEMLSGHLNIPLVGSGELLRDLSETHPDYAMIHSIIARGDPAPQDKVAKLLEERVAQSDCANGFVLDGWGRTMLDLEYFNPGFDKVIVLTLSRETSVKRITGRRICEADGKTYNIYTLPKEELEKCPGALVQRDDDTEEAVNRRLDIYYAETLKVVNYFRGQELVVEVNAEGTPNEVFQATLSALKLS